MDFLADGNVAGQNLLAIVSRGSAIIAELLRLSDNIPPVFFMGKEDAVKYKAILHDFSYLKNAELHENKISEDVALLDLDEEFRETNIEIIERFYKLFESIYKYIVDLNRYLQDIEEGVYIQLRMEDLLVNETGKQLLSESIYLYGVMLTLLDARIEGPVRERILISYYRYKGSSEIHSKVCNLCRSTGYLPATARRPPKYPEDYFSRLAPPPQVVSMVVNRLRSDDIYNQMKEWPNPDHRCTALSTQAAMVYVILFFVPGVLHKENATMREIVDKHMSDNWVLPFYMGFIVDLSIMWEPYKAAMSALNNTLEPKLVKEVCFLYEYACIYVCACTCVSMWT
jgi:WASH complex subunit strumpellin